MASKVIMPKLSPTMEEGQIARWLKKEGDKVSMGEPLAEIDTDKATMEMQALANGVLLKILINEGQSAPLGQLIAVVGEPNEDISSILNEAAAPSATAQDSKPSPEQGVREPAQATHAQSAPTPAQTAPPSSTGTRVSTGNGDHGAASSGDKTARIIVSPLAARMAAEAGPDLRQLQGR